MKIIVNAGSGSQTGEALCARLNTLFQAKPGELDIHLVRAGGDVAELARQLAGKEDPIIVAAGGDGTISSVAAALVGTDKTLGVLPNGTLNHFAKDLQIPLDLAEAANVIREGNGTLVDVGEVNGHIFLNNSNVGIYPSLVRDREEQQQRFKRGKWMAFLRAFFDVANRFPMLELTLLVDGKQFQRRTPCLFVGNNRYEMETTKIGTRSALDGGELSFFVSHQSSAFPLFLLGLRSLFGRLHAAKDFDAFCATEATIKATRHHLDVTADGEILRMETPLNFRVLPKSLRIFVPQRKSGS